MMEPWELLQEDRHVDLRTTLRIHGRKHNLNKEREFVSESSRTRGEQKQKNTGTCLIRTLTFLDDVLRSLDFGPQSEVKLQMAPWIRHFKVGTVIQFPFQVALPSKWGRVLALAAEARLDTQGLQQLL